MDRFNNMPNGGFPGVPDSSFPGVSNINVYGIPDFDYSKFANRQMRIKLLSVPWDLGEVHVGLKSVPMGNVVKFESDAERDAWLDAQPGVTFETRYRSYHDEDKINLPLPYEVIIPFNYIVIDYDEPPVTFGDMARVTRWLYFIRDVKSESMNNTACEIARDTWSMFVNSVEVKSMMLERGHAPMFAAPEPESYLANPIENNDLLLAEDVNFGTPSVTNMCSDFIVNEGDMYACFVTSADPRADGWGGENTNDWKVPSFKSNEQDGNVAPFVFAIAPDVISAFLERVHQSAPQFPQTVKGVFFAPKKLVNEGNSFTFCNTRCVTLTADGENFDLLMPSVDDFGFDDDCAMLTKLYTYPYSVLELTDEKGNVTEIRIEDCEGVLTVNACMSLSWPWVNVSCNVSGVGGSNGTVTFKNVDERTFDLGGRWYDMLTKWDVPIMAIYQGNGRTNDFATYFDRKTQEDNAKRDADTAKTNADAGADTARANARRSAKANYDNSCDMADRTLSNTNDVADNTYLTTVATSNQNKANSDRTALADKNNADAMADTVVTNAQLTNGANTASTARGNQSASQDTYLSNELSVALQKWNAGLTNETTAAEIEAQASTSAVSAVGNAMSSIAGVAMNPTPAGAVGSLANAAISGATTLTQGSVSINLTSTKAAALNRNTQETMLATYQNNTDRVTNQNSANTDITKINVDAQNSVAKNEQTTTKANATRTKTAVNANSKGTNDTETDNASKTQKVAKDNASAMNTTEKANYVRSRDAAYDNADASRDLTKANATRSKDTSYSDVEESVANQKRQSGLSAPNEFGTYANGETANTRPMGLFLNVVTQPKGAIRLTADNFKRYGYMYNGYWEFEGFNIGKRFSYWKCSDIWLKANNIPDAFADQIRNYLMQGVTIWRKPEFINDTELNQNM